MMDSIVKPWIRLRVQVLKPEKQVPQEISFIVVPQTGLVPQHRIRILGPGTMRPR